MIYSYKKHTTAGALGTTKTFNRPEDSSCVELGHIDNTYFVFVPDDVTLPEQPSEIELTEATLTSEQKDILRKQAVANLKKEELRKNIEMNVGDVHDLIADAMKLIEFNIMLTSRLAADYFGTTTFDATLKQEYATRNQQFLDSVENGSVYLRANFEDANDMLIKLMTRYSQIQHMVKDDYVDELAKIGL